MSQIENTKPRDKEGLIILNFIVQDVRICVYVNQVRQVLPLMALEPVPKASASMVGLMNLAGKSIPIIDLATCLGLNRTKKYTIETPILLCEDNHHTLGMIVDSIFGLEETSEHVLQMSQELSQPNSPFLGVIESEQGLSLLINMQSIFRSYLEGDTALTAFNGQWPQGVRHENP